MKRKGHSAPVLGKQRKVGPLGLTGQPRLFISKIQLHGSPEMTPKFCRCMHAHTHTCTHAQPVLAIKPEDLCLILKTHMLEGKN